MDAATLLGLAGLALVDSTSIGTLLIPLWMMLGPRLRTSRFAIYLGTVVVFYFAVGVVLVLGAGALRRALEGAQDSAAVSWAQLSIGVGLFALSFRYDSKALARRRLRAGRPDPVLRWRDRVAGDGGSPVGTVTLGLAAAGLEVMTMVPYLAAVGLIATADVGPPVWLPVLLGYVVVMTLPALVLFAARTVAIRRVQPMLERIDGWMTRNAAGALGWVLGIVGVLLALDAIQRLELFT